MENYKFVKLGVDVESSIEDADCLISDSFVALALLKVCKNPQARRKEECYSHFLGLKRIIEQKKREISYYEEKSLGLVNKRDSSGKDYWVEVTRILVHLRR